MRKTHFSLALLMALTATIVARADVLDVSLPLDTATSHLAIDITINGKDIVTAAIPFSGGSFHADIEQTGSLPPPLDLTNVSGNVDASPFAIHTILGNLSAKNLSLDLGPAAGPFLTDGQNPAQVNLAGLPISLDQGTISGFGFQLVSFAATRHWTLSCRRRWQRSMTPRCRFRFP